jgi:hypothetical protein
LTVAVQPPQARLTLVGSTFPGGSVCQLGLVNAGRVDQLSARETHETARLNPGEASDPRGGDDLNLAHHAGLVMTGDEAREIEIP